MQAHLARTRVEPLPDLPDATDRELGIRMDVVRSELRRRGGDAFIDFTGAAHNGAIPLALVLRL
jgi:hypothetical protein